MKDTLEKLRTVSGSNSKKLLLEIHKNDAVFHEYISYVFDPYTRYHVKIKQAEEFRKLPDGLFYTALDNISRMNGNKAAKDRINNLIEIYGRFATQVLCHNLDCGVGVGTAQKIFGPELVPSFDVILATSVAIPKVKLPALASIKFDGVRIIVLKGPEDEVARFFTRGGRELRIDNIMKNLPTNCDYMLDCELVYAEGAVEDRTAISGKVNSALAGKITEIDNSVLQVFDYLPYKAWASRDGAMSYDERYKHLNNFTSDNILKVEQITVGNTGGLTALYEGLISKGMEGLILRYPEDEYEWKRTKKLIKIKAIEECILICIGTKPGTGKYEGMIGALECKGVVNGTEVTTGIGSGLSDYDRSLPPEHYIGKQIDVEYNVVIDNSLFLPRFKRIEDEH